MPSPNQSVPTLAQLVADLQVQIAALQHRLDALVLANNTLEAAGDLNMQQHNVLNAGIIHAQGVVLPRGMFSRVLPVTLAPPQTNTNLMTHLSALSIPVIPANSNIPGAVYRLGITGTLSGDVGQMATINFGTVAEGPVMPMNVAVSAMTTNMPFILQATITFVSPLAFNADGVIQGFQPPAVVYGGFSFAGLAFNSAEDQTITLTYTTSNFTSITFNQIVMQRVL